MIMRAAKVCRDFGWISRRSHVFLERKQMIYEFTVEHEPVGQPRHRVGTIGGKSRLYLPSKHPVHGFKKAIRMAFGKKIKVPNAIEIVVEAWFSRPKSKTWKTRPMPSYRHIGKPDCDNVLKAVLDSLNGVAWVDDAQVSSATVRKFVCSGSCVPRVEILIRSLSE